MEHAVIQVLLLLLVAALVGMGARRVRMPYTLALVVAGITLGLFHFDSLHDVHLTPDLLLPIFLPALLFEAAYHVDFKRFRANAPGILLMAVPGVLLAVSITAGATWGLLRLVGFDMPIGHAFLLASVIAATDPISVLALFKTLGVDRRLYLLVEGESLLNDGVAVVVFVIVAAVIGVDAGHGHAPELHGASEIAVYGLRTLLWMAGAGVAIGAVGGMVVSVLTRQVDDRLIEIALSFILAYGSFIAAEQVHASGVLACVSAGIVLGSFGSRYGMSVTTRVAVVDFWEVLAFFSNSFVFLLVGIELDVPALVGHAGLVALVFVAVLLGRAGAVYCMLPLARFSKMEPVPSKWRHVMFWGGLRGSLSMVLVIGLPQDFSGRPTLLLLTFGVVSVSLFLQGLTMKPFMARLGLLTARDRQHDYEHARARTLAASHAARELAHQTEMGALHPAVRDRLSTFYAQRKAVGERDAARIAGDELGDERLQEAALHLLHVEEDSLHHAVAEGLISADVAEELLLDVAHRRELLRHGDDSAEAMEHALHVALAPPPTHPE